MSTDSSDIPPEFSAWAAFYKAIARTDELYLDTNVWSELAKGNLNIQSIVKWELETGGIITISRFQLAELSRAPSLGNSITELVSTLGAILIDRGQREWAGADRKSVGFDLFQPLRELSPKAKQVFSEEFLGGSVRAAAQQLRVDGDNFRSTVLPVFTSARKRGILTWNRFPRGLSQWMAWRAAERGIHLVSGWDTASDKYSGAKLAFALLFQRYFMGGKGWEESDYVDFLHAWDMAYAHTVVTERSLAANLIEIRKRHPGFTPNHVYDLSWFDADSLDP